MKLEIWRCPICKQTHEGTTSVVVQLAILHRCKEIKEEEKQEQPLSIDSLVSSTPKPVFIPRKQEIIEELKAKIPLTTLNLLRCKHRKTLKVLAHIMEHGSITTKATANILGKKGKHPRRKAANYLTRLARNGILKRLKARYVRNQKYALADNTPIAQPKAPIPPELLSQIKHKGKKVMRLLAYIAKHGHISVSKFALITGGTKKTASKLLNYYKNRGILRATRPLNSRRQAYTFATSPISPTKIVPKEDPKDSLLTSLSYNEQELKTYFHQHKLQVTNTARKYLAQIPARWKIVHALERNGMARAGVGITLSKINTAERLIRGKTRTMRSYDVPQELVKVFGNDACDYLTSFAASFAQLGRITFNDWSSFIGNYGGGLSQGEKENLFRTWLFPRLREICAPAGIIITKTNFKGIDFLICFECEREVV